MSRFSHLPIWARTMLLCLLAVVLSGCSNEPDIRRFKAPKPPKIEMDRMLAAIVPAGEKGWFFKLQGTSDVVTKELPKFQELLQSLEVKGDKVAWSKPDGWDEVAGSGMRAATFKINSKDAKLECTVISLPAEDPTTDEYLLSNINRWRGQMSLGNISKNDLAKASVSEGELRKMSLKDGTIITWVNIEGTASSGGSMPFADGMMGGAPFAGGRKPEKPEMGPGPSKPDESKAPQSDEFSYDVPEGWKRGTADQFRKAAFVVTHDGMKAEITVSSLPAAGSKLLPNVNRWRGQVELEAVDDEGLKKILEPIEVSGSAGHFVELAGKNKTILAVLVVVGEEGWFLKLTGPNQVAAKEKDNFRSFVKSFKIK